MGGDHLTSTEHGGNAGSDLPGDVEEALEPPLCGYNARHDSPHIQAIPRHDKVATGIATLVTSSISEGSDGGEWLNIAHALPISEVARLLDVNVDHGLSADEAAARLRRDGPNKIKETTAVSPVEILLRQVSNSLTLVLVIVMAISFAINDYIEAAVVTAVILLNVVIGFLQDYRAEQQIMSLQALSAPISRVLRSGQIQTVKAQELVVGDIVKMSVGDVVPADIRLAEAVNASTDEALLTGESLPVAKVAEATVLDRELALGDRISMCYAASTMTQGRATGIVVAAALNTEVGKIADLLRQRPRKDESSNMVKKYFVRFKDAFRSVLGLTGTPLQTKLSKFALLLFALAILLAIIVFSANLWDVNGEVLIYGICVAVAVIPESLIAVLTITMAVGTKAMAKGNVIVRKLQALEAVGGVSNICSDKTGTLTQGKMIARSAWIPGAGLVSVQNTTNPFDPNSGSVTVNEKSIIDGENNYSSSLETFLRAIALCNLSSVYDTNAKPANLSVESVNTDVAPVWTAVGEPTEIALHVLALRFGRGKTSLLSDGRKHLLKEYPFDSAIKRMTVVYQDSTDSTIKAYTKGATEAIVPRLTLSEQEKSDILNKAEVMASQGLRVLCIASRNFMPSQEKIWCDRTSTEETLDFCGLVGLYDPPRLGSRDAVAACKVAGIQVHMLTGDHISTARAIAAEVGILPRPITIHDGTVVQDSNIVMQADHFDSLSDSAVDSMPTLPLVLARCSPTTKVRMIAALHRRHAFCVMTGDGVNDSPSLKRADVGIAMGLNGSDVAKDAADMILTDDNFASIVTAVREGRRLFDNIQKFLLHLLVSNIAQVILLLCGLAFKDSTGASVFPLSPLEILWVNLITSSFLAIGLGLEQASADIMRRPPRDPRGAGVFTRELITDKCVYGVCMGALCLVAFASVAYGPGRGQLGAGCNDGYNASCDVTFRARATAYATLTALLLVTAWEVKHFTRSLFALDPARFGAGPVAACRAVWANRFLFWAVVAGFVVMFPVIYLPEVDVLVFKHKAIGWEWGVVAGCFVAYVACVELWKSVKRRWPGVSGSAAAGASVNIDEKINVAV
ncbi:hypothetical protein FH972_021558 [Carpinus fangiana]|uniref:P-type Na(+) transporter n=1 Tax=Carpinus fangiana TaxID=176857 RepID=A0A5N6KQ15_9ROSI|nr:hypothetical protein FH972_021558 [Carpinus fangiana]